MAGTNRTSAQRDEIAEKEGGVGELAGDPNGIQIHVRIPKAGFESQHGIQNVIEELCNLGIVDFVVKLTYFHIFLRNKVSA